VHIDVSSAYVFTSALLFHVLKLPRCFTCILIVGVSVACSYAAILLWRAASNVNIAISVRTFEGFYLLQFLKLIDCVMLMSLLDLNLGLSRHGVFCVTVIFCYC